MLCVVPNTYAQSMDVKDINIKEVLIEMLKNPKHAKDKSKVYLFHFYDLIANPIMLPGELNYKPRKINKNILNFEAIILDYDDGDITVEEAQEQFREYWHVGYTSFSHTPECHRFRVVLPLEKPLNAKWIGENREKIMEHYPHADKSSLNIARFFYAPCYKYFKNYLCWVSEGKPYRLPGKYPVSKKIKPTVDISEKLPSRDNPISKKLREYAVNKLYIWARKRLDDINFNIRGNGIVHASLLKINASLRHEGLDPDEILEVMLEYSTNPQTDQEIKSIINKYDP